MEFTLLAVALLFIIPFPSKWKFVWQMRFLGLALLSLTSGITLSRMDGLAGQVGGVVLILVSLIFLYLALRRPRRAPRSGEERK
jgi:hypothetical protein